MVTFAPLLSKEALEKCAVSFLNSGSLKRVITSDKVVGAELKFHPFLELNAEFDVEYAYQKGVFDSSRFDQASQNYQIAYNQYVSAKSLHTQAYNNAKDSQKMNLFLNPPVEPTRPDKKDYVLWKERITEEAHFEGKLFQPVKPEYLPKINGKNYADSPDIKFSVPVQMIENTEFRVISSSHKEMNDLMQNYCESMAEKVAAEKVKGLQYRDLSNFVKINRSNYANTFLPLWEVTYDDNGKNKKIYIDELNNVICGEMIDESDIWLSIAGKHLSLFIGLWILLTEGGQNNYFIALVSAILIQVTFFVLLKSSNTKNESKSGWSARILNFFHIKELSKSLVSNAKTNSLDFHLREWDGYEKFTESRKQNLSVFNNSKIFQI